MARKFASNMSRMGAYPGSVDASVARPDIVKFEYQTFLENDWILSRARSDFERQYSTGRLSLLAGLEHWSTEKFLWRGDPDLATHPLDAFLEHAGTRFSPAAREQLLRCKEARLGFFEIGRVGDGTVRLRAWDVERRAATGEWFDAIDLSIDGVDNYRNQRGSVLFTYLAPWAPEERLFCSMGFSFLTTQDDTPALALHLNLNHADYGQRQSPWNVSSSERRRFLEIWKKRDWLPWLCERISVPFAATVAMPDGPMLACAVQVLDHFSRRESEDFGNYMIVEGADGEIMVGMTGVAPLDLTSATAAAMSEYSAYRKLAGPPAKAHLINELRECD